MKRWTIEEEDKLKKLYPNTKTEDLCRIFGRNVLSIYNKAYALRIKKSAEYLESNVYTIAAESGRKSRFKKGHKPWNFGHKGLQIGGTSTQFKLGHIPHNTKENGATRLSKDGYLEIRTSVGCYEFVHRLVWIKHHGEIPPGYAVVFKDGNPMNLKISNLECISRSELMKRNSFLRYPEDVRKLIRVKAVLTRVINQKKESDE
jgi:hypothetical protein